MAITREVIGSKIWSETGDKTEPSESFITDGWVTGVKPPRQYMNWLQHVLTNNIGFFEQEGFFEWDATVTYGEFGIVRATDDVLYISIVAANLNNNPSGGADTTNWENLYDYLGRNSARTVTSYLKTIDSTSAESIAGEVVLSPGTYDIHCIGGGGGGSASNQTDNDYDGHGGGGAAAVMSRVVLTSETTLSLSIGAGGAGGTTGGAGGAGGTTTIGTNVAVGGGGGDAPVIAATGGGGYGGDADSCTGDIKWSGASAALAYRRIYSLSALGASASFGGAAGGPFGGNGGGAGDPTVTPLLPGKYGAGGAGGNQGNDGFDGADGVIFIVGVR